MSQEYFSFGFAARLRDDNFIVSLSNERALALMESWPKWNSHAILIYGPKSSGKTMLARIWAKMAKAVFVQPQDIYKMSEDASIRKNGCYISDGIENIHDEASFLHFFNNVKEDGGFLLMTASTHPQNLKIRLADLRSRINSVISTPVANPDDELLKTLFFKHFSARQLKVGMDVINYLVSRSERSFESVEKTVDLLDKEALKEKKNITIPFVRAVLKEMDG